MSTNEPEPQAFIGMINNEKASVSSEWWLESGATCHITNDRNLLIEVIEVKDTVENCSGDETNATHVETANLVLSSKSRNAEFFENEFLKDHGLSASGSTDMILESPIESEASPSDTNPTQLVVESVPVRAEAIDDEMSSLLQNFTWQLVNLPKRDKVIGLSDMKANLTKEFDMKDFGITNTILGMKVSFESCTKPNIAFIVGMLSRFTSNPSKEHWDALDRLMRYLKGTKYYALHCSGYPSIVDGYSNTSWSSEMRNSKFTSGYVFTLGGATIA
ncbi:uncharacterized protein LOC133307693 [Gastrolobium bilobum]|uniref:uncharacterized protein LOC133307693 n=1 Tax=Gastrolobium bilobum TaxID=150636 RepID=UPI002AB1E2F9|nr:uncharacterized protein LOC133307693 [Gastrolobium bilobum]